jgi:hypothetical protein
MFGTGVVAHTGFQVLEVYTTTQFVPIFSRRKWVHSKQDVYCLFSSGEFRISKIGGARD